jgi:D-alanyl-D-alanine carboxypeptidase
MTPTRIIAGPLSPTGVSGNRDVLDTAVEALATAHRGAAVAIVAPLGMTTGAAGKADPDGRAMTPDTPIRIASLTKSFTAAAILRLWETGRLDLDAPIGALIPAAQGELLRAGGHDPTAITVRHLALHSSGLADHAQAAAFQSAVFADPGRVWTRGGQLAVLVEAASPVGQPGAQFHYSDTGYVILGGIIERQTGLHLGDAIRDLLRLKETTIRWEGEPPADGAVRAHQWVDETDTFFIHGSVDAFGGGGMIASVEATARAYDALISGSVFDTPRTLETMLTAPGHPEGSPYRMGFYADRLSGFAVYRHAGFWGIEALVVPERRLVIVAAVLDQTGSADLRMLVDRLALDQMQ